MDIAGTVKNALNEIGFDNSKEKCDLILSVTIKIILYLGKNAEQTLKTSRGDTLDIAVKITEEEKALLDSYDLDPPPLNALYTIINALFADFNIEADNISREGTTLKVKLINKK